MRKLLAILLMFLLPLQALQAAGMDACVPGPVQAATAVAVQALHAEPGHHGHGHAHDPVLAQAAHDHGHGPSHAASADTADHDHGPDVHGCCHGGASLPARHVALTLHAPARPAVWLRPLPALSHETSGPFRPPRAVLA